MMMMLNMFKSYVLLLLLLESINNGVVVVSAGSSFNLSPPEVTIGLNGGVSSDGGISLGNSLGGIEPQLKWSGEGEIAGIEVQGGIDTTIVDLDNCPTSIWARITKNVKGLGSVSVRGDTDVDINGSNMGKNVAVSMPSIVDVNVQIDTKDGSTIQLSGSVEASPPPSKKSRFFSSKSKSNNNNLVLPKVNIDNINFIKAVKVGHGIASINPRYSIGGNGGGFDGISIGYGIDNTSLKIDTKSKRLTVTQNFLQTNSISPSINTANGDVSLSYTKSLIDGSKLTTVYTPNNSIQVKYIDTSGGWQTTIKAPLDGYIPDMTSSNNGQGITISTKRNL